MAEIKFDVDFINQLMELVSKNDMGELTIENGTDKIKIAAKKPAPIAGTALPVSAPAAAGAPAAPSQEKPAESSAAAIDGKQVTSPIVGTFYAAPSPDRDPFIRVGQKVKKGDVLFIIESMKLMNEIQSEYDGEVAEILCTDGQAVEFGQPIVIIK